MHTTAQQCHSILKLLHPSTWTRIFTDFCVQGSNIAIVPSAAGRKKELFRTREITEKKVVWARDSSKLDRTTMFYLPSWPLDCLLWSCIMSLELALEGRSWRCCGSWLCSLSCCGSCCDSLCWRFWGSSPCCCCLWSKGSLCTRWTKLSLCIWETCGLQNFGKLKNKY